MSKIFNLKWGHLKALLKEKLPLECLFALELLINGEEVPEELLSYQQRLVRKGYIDMRGAVMPAGVALYHSLFKEVDEIIVKKREKKPLEKFDEWWNDAFCSSDNFEIRGMKFPGSRKLTTDKEGCRKIFNALIVNEFTADEVIQATKYHMELTKKLSYADRRNRMSFIPNSLRYLREKYFQPYIKSSEGGEEKKEEFEI